MSELHPPTRTDSLFSALAELVPGGIGAFLKTLLVDSAHRQAAETGEVLRRVAQDVGEELFSRSVEESPRLRSLLLNAVDQCYRTSFQQKRWRLAEALKDCILDPSKINAAVVEQQVLRDVEVPHIQVLDKLARIDLRLQALPADEGAQYVEGEGEYRKAWNGFPAPITAVLVSAGLAKELTADFLAPGMDRHTLVTPYGHKVLEDFRRLGMQLDGAARPRSSHS